MHYMELAMNTNKSVPSKKLCKTSPKERHKCAIQSTGEAFKNPHHAKEEP